MNHPDMYSLRNRGWGLHLSLSLVSSWHYLSSLSLACLRSLSRARALSHARAREFWTPTGCQRLLAGVSGEDRCLPLPGLPHMGAFSLLCRQSFPDSWSSSTQMITLPENGKSYSDWGRGALLKYNLFVLSAALPKLCSGV